MTASETTEQGCQIPCQTTSPNSWQHPCNSHISQLIIRQGQREAHALDFPESSEEFQRRLIVPLFQGSQINQLLLYATTKVMGMELLF
jgi:hypothetical protein